MAKRKKVKTNKSKNVTASKAIVDHSQHVDVRRAVVKELIEAAQKKAKDSQEEFKKQFAEAKAVKPSSTNKQK